MHFAWFFSFDVGGSFLRIHLQLLPVTPILSPFNKAQCQILCFCRFCFVLDYILGCFDFSFDFGTFKKGYQFTEANHVLLHVVSAWMKTFVRFEMCFLFWPNGILFENINTNRFCFLSPSEIVTSFLGQTTWYISTIPCFSLCKECQNNIKPNKSIHI